jgi:hypothetical protein
MVVRCEEMVVRCEEIVVRCTQMLSDALRCTQMHSDALRCTHLPFRGVDGVEGANVQRSSHTRATKHNSSPEHRQYRRAPNLEAFIWGIVERIMERRLGERPRGRKIPQNDVRV